MQLAPGVRLAQYEIVAAIGKGGMGEVFRARDTRLGREVAIKVLPEEFTRDAERLARFEREARVLASLNHPHIAAIHGFEEAEGMRFLAMELAAGEDLSARLDRGAIPPEEAIEIALQIADALDVAHEKGIIHRDLKPANIKLSDDGRVKLLDFGLAKALELEEGDPELSNSPTMVRAATHAGVILGTAAYMSPEQARGKKVDKRADIWAFGVVLFEMLTGQRLFSGETVSDTLAAVLTREADFSLLPAAVPARVKTLLRRCLERDVKKRLRDIGEARIALASPETEAEPVESVVLSRRLPRAAAAGIASLLLVAGVAAGWLVASKRGVASAGSGRAVHLEIPFPGRETTWAMLGSAISPDGRRLAFGTVGPSGRSHLWLRELDRFEPKALAGTEDALQPFWSPDSRTLGFFAAGGIRRMDVETGTVQTICDCAPAPRGGSWHETAGILFAPNPNTGISKIAASGGEATIVTTVEPSIPDASHRYPQWLPDGDHFLFTLWSNSAEALKSHGGVYVGSISGKTPPKRILSDASSATFVAPGWILVRRNEAMVAVAFDPKSLMVGAEVVPVDENAMFESNIGALIASASKRGDIAWNVGLGNPPVKLVWLGRDGSELGELEPEGIWYEPALSPDGQRLAVTRVEGTSATQIWIRELARNTLTPLTRTVNDSYSAIWSPVGDRVAYMNRDSGTDEIFVQGVASTVPAERVYGNPELDCTITDWSGDGRLIFIDASPKIKEGSRSVWVWDFAEKKARPVLADTFNQRGAALSPDGRWLAYASNETGTYEIFLRPWPALDRKWMVSSGGGFDAHWSGDGRELLFGTPAAEGGFVLNAVTLEPDANAPNPTVPRRLAAFDSRVSEFVPTADHARILAVRTVESDAPLGMRAILGWTRSLGENARK